MAYDRQWIIEILQHLGYAREADDAVRELPAEPTEEELLQFAAEHSINRGDLMDRMGGSP
jgi:hypothetical protein